MYLTVAIANGFLKIAKRERELVDPMKVQKLVYFAHGWHLGYGLGPLSVEYVQAWHWGPVFPELYHAVRIWGRSAVLKPLNTLDPCSYSRMRITPRVPAEDTIPVGLIQRVWQIYGPMSGPALSQLTLEPSGPWRVTWDSDPGAPHLIIPNKLIRKRFEGKLAASRERAAAGAAS